MQTLARGAAAEKYSTEMGPRVVWMKRLEDNQVGMRIHTVKTCTSPIAAYSLLKPQNSSNFPNHGSRLCRPKGAESRAAWGVVLGELTGQAVCPDRFGVRRCTWQLAVKAAPLTRGGAMHQLFWFV